jgi:hypothetical protein
MVRGTPGHVIGWAVLILAGSSAQAQLPACFAGFDVSPDCITQRGLAPKLAKYQLKISEALRRLGASYQLTLRPVNHPVEAGYDAATIGDVFTDVVRDEEMRNQAFIINVTTDFLEKQPEILFEASSLHEICHIMNDDLNGYHRNGANIEVAEEHCVLQAVGEARYEQYLKAYAVYQHWASSTYDTFLQAVQDVALVPPPSEIDDADRAATEYFRRHADGSEHLVVFNGELHDISLYSTKRRVWHDPEKLKPVIQAGRPVIFFHNHPGEAGKGGMFPGYDDFGAAGLLSFMVYAENPKLPVEFRVIQAGKEPTIVSYGFKRAAVEDIQSIARQYRRAVELGADVRQIEIQRDLLDNHLARDSFSEYLQYASPAWVDAEGAGAFTTHPQYFIWPSERFFLHYRPQ